MRRLAQWMMRLYPARWRARYGDELDALLAETGADARVVLDLFRGGVRMQFSTWSFARLAVVLGISGLILGAAGSFLIAPVYLSEAVLRVEPLAAAGSVASPDAVNDMVAHLRHLIFSRTQFALLINQPSLNLYRNELKTTPLEDVIERMRGDMTIDTSADSIRIAFRYTDPVLARMTVSEVIARLKDLAANYRRVASPETVNFNLMVLDVPSLPVRPYFPTLGMVATTGAFIGVCIVLGWQSARKRRLMSRRAILSAIALGFVCMIAANVVYVLDQGDGRLGLFRERYRSSATMMLAHGDPAQIQSLTTEVLSRTSLSLVINDPHLRLYAQELKTEPLEDVIDDFRKNVSIVPDAQGRSFTITFEYGDRYKAMQTVQVLMTRIDDIFQRTHHNDVDYAVLPRVQFSVVNEPSTPILPIKPNRYVITGIGGLAGLFLAAVTAAIRRRWRPEPEIPLDPVNG